MTSCRPCSPSPNRVGAKLMPSVSFVGSASMMSSTVASTSHCADRWSVTVPGSMWPGQRAIIGTRMPPS